jgi:hypothetical protein
MNRSRFILLTLACAMCLLISADAQTVSYFPCLTGCAGSLESNTAPLSTGQIVSVAGYYQPGDGGSGSFVVLGQQSSSFCRSYNTATGTVSQNSNTITSVTDVTGLHVGTLISGAGILAGSEVASISTVMPYQITITQAANQLAGGPFTSLTFTANNTGTLILDNATGGADCFQKTNYRGDPHEWGAYGDATNTGATPHDDTTALKNWLGAAGILPATTPTSSFPTNFGPWVASLPGAYEVTSPLTCPANANIQAPANITSGNVANGGVGSPPVRIVAASNFAGISSEPGEPAVIMASAYCRLSGIAVDASNVGAFYSTSVTGTITNNSTAVSSFNNCTGVVAGMPVSGTDIPVGTTFATANCITHTAALSQAATGSHTGESLTVTGFYAVDVAGTHVAIDSHAWLYGGFDNVRCGDTKVDGLQVKDAQIVQAVDEGIYLGTGCGNVRLLGDLISGNGSGGTGPNGFGAYFSGDDLSIEGGVIEQSGGVGLDIESGKQVSVTGMYFDNNGKALGGPGISMHNSSYISICGNHFHRNGGDGLGTTSHVYFSGNVDSVELCGNVYFADNTGADPQLRPSYVYDMASGTVLSNAAFHESATPQVNGVASSTVAPVIQPLQVPQVTKDQIDGLIMSNGATGQVSISSGSAADSTGVAIITLPASCTVDLGSMTNGAGALDTGSVAANTTYNFYVIAAPGSTQGTPANPSCMASTASPPVFSATTSFANSGYLLEVTGWTVSGSNVMNNVLSDGSWSLTSARVGDAIVPASGTPFPSTTISQFGTSATISLGTSTGWSKGATTIPVTSTPAGLLDGMIPLDGNNTGCFANNTQIQSFVANTSITISPGAGCTESGPLAPISASPGNEITLGAPATSSGQVTAWITIALYRQIGPLYTTTGSPVPVVSFKQDGNIFYLTTSVKDISTNCTINVTTAVLCPLSVPQTDKIDAFGRFLGGANNIFVSSPDQSDQAPSAFSTGAPGYSTSSATGNTSFPFFLETNTSGEIRVRSAGSTNTVYEVTDGWVWRGRK